MNSLDIKQECGDIIFSAPRSVPCRGCKERTVTPPCHGYCVKYLTWRTNFDKNKENVLKKTVHNTIYSDYIRTRVGKRCRKRRKNEQ